MNTPSPLIPQGMLPENRGKSQLRIAVITIVAVHVVLLGALLLQGCKKSADPAPEDQAAATNPYAPPPMDTNALQPPPPLPPPTDPSVNTPTQDTSVVTPPPYTPPTPPIVEPPTPPPQQPQSMSEHVIVKGDSFAVLAKKYGVSVKAIVSANPNVNPTRLKIGQKVNIPAPSAAPTTSEGTPAPTNGGNGGEGAKTYTVKSGDNLTKIARTQGVTVKELRAANKLKMDRISVGQKLRIPVKASSATTGTPATNQ